MGGCSVAFLMAIERKPFVYRLRNLFVNYNYTNS
jgi:hypothetical protein